MPQEVDFAAMNLSKGPVRILYVTFLKTRNDHINPGLTLFKDLKTSHIKARKCLCKRKFQCYPEEVHRSFCCCYTSHLVFCGESLGSLNIVIFCKTPNQ